MKNKRGSGFPYCRCCLGTRSPVVPGTRSRFDDTKSGHVPVLNRVMSPQAWAHAKGQRGEF